MRRTVVVAFACVGMAGAIGVVATSCGGSSDPYCGDGDHQPELGEQCDDGNDIDTDSCRNNCTANLPGQFTVSWVFNKDEAPEFTADSCTDLGVTEVEVEVVGPATQTMRESCALRQVVFQGLPAGTYSVRVRPLNAVDELLTTSQIEESFVLNDGTSVEVVIPYGAWKNSYTGTFFFRIEWGGADCSAASPPVEQHVLRLEQGGVPVAQSTGDGDPLDGSAPGPCQPFANEFPVSALNVPFGPATFIIEGRNGGTAEFRESFETFVGAGISNPELHFDVNSLQPDAGVADAGVPDANPMDAL